MADPDNDRRQYKAVGETAYAHPIGCTCGHCDGKGSVVTTITYKADSPNTPEPPPLPNPGEPTVLSLVLADLQERAEHGLKKYKQYLTAGDGRDHLMDLYQELMDAVMYIRQEIRERERSKQTK